MLLLPIGQIEMAVYCRRCRPSTCDCKSEALYFWFSAETFCHVKRRTGDGLLAGSGYGVRARILSFRVPSRTHLDEGKSI
jgi:hypothetical protein